MLKIIPHSSFKTIPWKNGKGSTLELAISPNGRLDDFDWRLSIATVENDGVFSDFTGYTRNLVLIDGKGIILHHNENHIDHLNNKLEYSTFDGANKSNAKLVAGTITDFNLMTRSSTFNGRVETFVKKQKVVLEQSQLCFIYSHSNDLEIKNESNNDKNDLSIGSLLQITNNLDSQIIISGENFIAIYINKK